MTIIRLCTLVLVLLQAIIQPSHSYLDFYISSDESYSLLGTRGTLYYVYDASVNLNSLAHTLRLSDEKRTLNFVWRAHKELVSYKINFNSSIGPIITSLDVPPSGYVPTKPSNLTIEISCGNLAANDVPFDVKIEFRLSESKKQLLEIKLSYETRCNGSVVPDHSYSQTRRTPSTGTSSNDFLIAYISFSILLIFVATLGLFALKLYLDKRSKKSREEAVQAACAHLASIDYDRIKAANSMSIGQKEAEKLSRKMISNQNIYETLKDLTVFSQFNQTSNQTFYSRLEATMSPDGNCGEAVLVAEATSKPPSPLPPVKPKRSRVDEILKGEEFKISSEDVTLERVVMDGTFSKFYEGLLRQSGEQQAGNYVKVLVKTVNDCASAKQTDLMLTQSCLFRKYKHKHLNSILGVCIEPERHPMVIFPFCEHGNLKIYLQKFHKNAELAVPSLSTQELLYMILQLIKGVNFLHSKHILHRDIASRNCWLDSNLSVKLADNALSRDMFPNDYHCLGDNENRPIKWMALETLLNNLYSVQSDIWSLGVTMWEIMSVGIQPYADKDPFDMQEYLEDDLNRLDQPLNCPNELYEMFKTCWLKEPKRRPQLKDLFQNMLQFYSTLGNFF